MRRALGLGAALGVLLPAGAAPADEALARRLAALQAIVRPEVARAAAREAREPRPGCGPRSAADVPGLHSRIDRAVRDASLRFGVDPALVRAVIRHESNYDPGAVSWKGAMGLMQLMPATARELGVVCAFEPRENVMAGARYLRRLRDRLGSWPRALAGYHAGPRRVEAGRIPHETRRYVRRVVGSWRPGLVAWIDLP